MQRLFKDDQVDDKSLIEGASSSPKEPYPDCLQRFVSVLNNQDQKHDQHGNQLWGLGYGSSANNEDDD